VTPRIVRFRDARHYVGMDRNRFNAEVRPHVTEIPIASRGSASTAMNLMLGCTSMSAATGVPHEKEQQNGTQIKYQDSPSGAGSGTSTSSCSGGEFARALAHLDSKKPSEP
jgi:hypothetical protein